jgi:hypothetical protein
MKKTGVKTKKSQLVTDSFDDFPKSRTIEADDEGLSRTIEADDEGFYGTSFNDVGSGMGNI